ncbi:uncharacterized protein LOC117120797, partial [Anneissia japonica]|uniref:uncharacterized protein LOC117120797 n=1 Tax=Anneissia japonica TaxID=1529436 RepID=UPI0014257653
MEDAGDVEGNQLQRNKGDIQITRPNTSASMDSIQEYQSNSTDDNDSVEPMEIDKDNENEHEMVQNDVVPQIDENNANRKKKNVLPPCPAWCKKKCTEKISKDQREGINQEYWMLSKEQQRVWLLSHAEATVPKRTNPNATNPRKHTYTYSLMSEDYGNVQVCRTFFLTTLGFKSTSNCVITWLFKLIAEQGTGVYAPKDGRGRHGNHAHKLSDEKKKVIKDHIMSHHPCISHYRREHAPNRLYLPPELNVTVMFADFNDKHPGVCKYQTYRKMIRDLNISFARLGKEECEI